jgi:hypothetical protein
LEASFPPAPVSWRWCDCNPCAIVITVARLWYRPLVSLGVVVVGLAIAYGFKRVVVRRVAARSAQRRLHEAGW